MTYPILRKFEKMHFDKAELSFFSRSVLGDEYYKLIKNFFEEIWNSSYTYKVFLARRCLNLMYLFYKYREAPNDSYLGSDLYSDSSLLASVPEIADIYMDFGMIPQILVVDDIMIHGRSINAFIDSLVSSILNYCEKKGRIYKRGKVEQAVHDSLKIKVLVQNNRFLLLNRSFINCIECSIKCSPSRWHVLSSRITQLVSEGYFSNTSYTLSLYERKKEDLHSFFEESAEKAGFRKSKRRKSLSCDVWIRPLKNSSGDIMAMYTLRFVKNAVDKKYRITPFVISSDMVCKMGSFPTEGDLLINNYKSEYADIPGIARTRAEAISMLLSQNVLLLLQKNILQSGRLAQEIIEPGRLDAEKISLNFKKRRYSQKEDFFDILINLKEPFAEWEEIDSFILKSTANSAPLVKQHDIKLHERKTDISVEDFLAKQGFEIERQAYDQLFEGVQTSIKANKQPLCEFFSKISRHLSFDDESIIDITGDLLRYMDDGTVAVTANYSDDVYSCVYRACEHSQFIYPLRYIEYLPVLSEIEYDCGGDVVSVKQTIEEFFSPFSFVPREDITGMLEFVEMLYGSGQYIIDWDINLLNMIKGNNDQGADDSLSLDKLITVARRNDFHTRYRQLYPES